MVQILRDRNLIIDETAIPVLKRENYYCLINGYKDFFLDDSSPIEQYKNGTTFHDIYHLFRFDREIRHIFFKRILDVETTLKSVISYLSCEHFEKEPEFYLDQKNYTDEARRNQDVEKSIAMLHSLYDSGDESITHYREKHGSVPFWILCKNMTLGSLSYFYDLLDSDKLKSKIAIEFKGMSHVSLSGPSKFRIKDIKRDLMVLTDFRNVCAHSERFYCHTYKKVRVNPDTHADAKFLFEVLERYSTSKEMDGFVRELESVLTSFNENGTIASDPIARYFAFLGLSVV